MNIWEKLGVFVLLICWLIGTGYAASLLANLFNLGQLFFFVFMVAFVGLSILGYAASAREDKKSKIF